MIPLSAHRASAREYAPIHHQEKSDCKHKLVFWWERTNMAAGRVGSERSMVGSEIPCFFQAE